MGMALSESNSTLDPKDRNEDSPSVMRRSILRAAVLGVVGLGLASQFGELVRPAYAADGDYIRVGYTLFGSSETYLSSSTGGTTFHAANSNTVGWALEGDASGSSGIGVMGIGGFCGLRGSSSSFAQYGVWGSNQYGRGVVGTTFFLACLSSHSLFVRLGLALEIAQQSFCSSVCVYYWCAHLCRHVKASGVHSSLGLLTS